MSGTNTTRMISAYNEYRESERPILFLSGYFRSPIENFYTSEDVEYDVTRMSEPVAIPVQAINVGYRSNAADLYVNKRVTPPVIKELITVSSSDLIKRQPGSDPFQEPNYRANLMVRVSDGLIAVENKIRRTIELQASQVLQQGFISLVDEDGNEVFGINYKPKASHFPISATSWSSASGQQKLDDIDALAHQIRTDGNKEPDTLIFGRDAYRSFINDDFVKKNFDIKNINLGTIAPVLSRGIAKYVGVISIGSNVLDIWLYDGQYDDPQTGESIPYVTPNKVIVRASTGRLDATFGGIPNMSDLIGNAISPILKEFPGRLSSVERSMDMFVNSWASPDGQQVFTGIGTRPLMIPVAMDTFGCLDTQI